MSLTDKYRPRDFRHMVGHRHVVTALQGGKDWKSILFYGPPGIGKTSFARIVGMWLNCSAPVEDSGPCGKCEGCLQILNNRSIDYREENVADSRGIDAMRGIVEWLRIRPLSLKKKVLVLDEIHQVTSAGQQLLLKVLEEPPSYCVIILCTTDIEGLLATLLQRCSKFRLDLLSQDLLIDLLAKITDEEKLNIDSSIAAVLVERSQGSPRQLLMDLELIAKGGKIASIDSEDPVLLELFNLVLGGQSLIVSQQVSIALEKYSADEVFGRMIGYYKAMLRRIKNKEQLLLVYGILKEIMNVQRFYMDKEGKVLMGAIGAALVVNSIRGSLNSEIE